MTHYLDFSFSLEMLIVSLSLKEMIDQRTPAQNIFRQMSNISHILVGNTIVDHSDVVEAASVGAAPTTSSFLT